MYVCVDAGADVLALVLLRGREGRRNPCTCILSICVLKRREEARRRSREGPVCVDIRRYICVCLYV
jgi:hypothetical protein